MQVPGPEYESGGGDGGEEGGEGGKNPSLRARDPHSGPETLTQGQGPSLRTKSKNMYVSDPFRAAALLTIKPKLTLT